MDEPGSIGTVDLELYASHMEQIKARINAAHRYLAESTYPGVESGLLQLRQALEALALSSLITNRQAVGEVSSAFRKKDHWEALKIARRVNPHFWPTAVTTFDGENGLRQWVEIAEDIFLESEYGRLYGDLSKWLHATNPFREMPELSRGMALGTSAANRIISLLNSHTANLAGRNEVVFCTMNTTPSGAVHVYIFEPIEGSAVEAE